ncbi:MAG: Calx-beta domain-containing protein, partial [Methylocella sp.]
PPPTVQFASGYYVVNENAGTVTLTVTLSIPMSSVVTVNYATGDGTAVAGTDYAASSGTVTFPANVTSQTISVGVIDNGSYTDQAVYFTVTLSTPSPNVILGTQGLRIKLHPDCSGGA